jgi:hypothetical protein
MAKMWFSSHLASNEISMHEYRALTFTKCTTIMIAELMIMSDLGSSRD